MQPSLKYVITLRWS